RAHLHHQCRQHLAGAQIPRGLLTMLNTLGRTVVSGQSPRPLKRSRNAENNPRAIAFLILLWLALAIAIVFLITLVVVTMVEGWDRFDSRLWEEYPSRKPEQAGARPAILGSLWVVG